MGRLAVLFVVAGVAAPLALAAEDDGAYVRANERLARAVPHYPRARLLIEEKVWGEVDGVGFEAVQRIAFLARPRTQRAIDRFYADRLGPRWRRQGAMCHVSGARAVVTALHPGRRRLALLIDTRGAKRCAELAGLMLDLLDVGYPTD